MQGLRGLPALAVAVLFGLAGCRMGPLVFQETVVAKPVAKVVVAPKTVVVPAADPDAPIKLPDSVIYPQSKRFAKAPPPQKLADAVANTRVSEAGSKSSAAGPLTVAPLMGEGTNKSARSASATTASATTAPATRVSADQARVGQARATPSPTTVTPITPAPAAPAPAPPSPRHSLATVPKESVAVGVPTAKALDPNTVAPRFSNPAVEQLHREAARAIESGDLHTADVRYEQALRIEPRDAWLMYELASVRVRQGELVRARGLIARSQALGYGDETLRQANERLLSEVLR